MYPPRLALTALAAAAVFVQAALPASASLGADPTPAPVPEASTTISFGLMLAAGVIGLVIAARRKKAAAPSA